MNSIKKLLCILTAASFMLMGLVPAYAVVNGIFLGSDENGVNILNDRLRPGEEYYFPMLVATKAAAPMQITAEDLKRSKLEVRVASGGNAIEAAAVEEKNGLAYLRVVPGSKGTVQELTATVRINYRSGDTGENITVTPSMRIGYNQLDENAVEALGPGEFLELDNLNPIISGKQWNALSELNEHKDVTLLGKGWRFTVNAAGMGKGNLVTDHRPVMELTQKYPDHKMHFIGFPGAPDFDAAGRLWLDVSDFAEEYKDDFYLYRCAYGKTYPLKFDYDKDAGEITFRPSQLSTYLITDKKLPESASDAVDVDAEIESEAVDSVPQQNPNTGEPMGFPALMTALVSLAGLGVLAALKRR